MMEAIGSLPAMKTLGVIMRMTGMPINDPRLSTLTRNQAEVMYWVDLMSDPKKLKTYRDNKNRPVDADFEEEFNKVADDDDWEKV